MLLLAALSFLIIYAYPGYTSPDSAVQLGQARSGLYSDGHPPLMAAVWGVLDHVVAGPLGMLLLQGAAFIGGLFLIFRRRLEPLAAAIATCVVFIAPVVFPTLAVIWKDSQMAAFLVLGVGSITSPRPLVRGLGVVALIYAVGVRYNAPAAALPLVVLLWPSTRRWIVRIATAGGVWLVAVLVAMLCNAHLVEIEEHSWPRSIAPADIVGILHNTQQAYSDAELNRLLEGTSLKLHEDIQYHARRSYYPESLVSTIEGNDRTFDWATTEAQFAAMKRAWPAFVRAEPRAWLQHRLRVFRAVLGLGPTMLPMVSTPVFHSYQLGEFAADSPPQRAIRVVLDGLSAHTPIYKPWLYLLATLVLLWFARRDLVALAFLLSGLLYELTYVPLAPSSEWRYSHWMITCTVIAAALLVCARQRVMTVTGALPSA